MRSIYDKGGSGFPLSRPFWPRGRVHVLPLPNVGRESHTWLTHMSRLYNHGFARHLLGQSRTPLLADQVSSPVLLSGVADLHVTQKVRADSSACVRPVLQGFPESLGHIETDLRALSANRRRTRFIFYSK